ncbi:DEAD/DEAH box helicase [Streptococcus salivarius]
MEEEKRSQKVNLLTLKKLYNTGFPDLYYKFLKQEIVDESDLEKILSLALYFVCLDDEELIKLGYRLFILYSKYTYDYKPLYEVSLNKGLIPISHFISDVLEYDEQYGNSYTFFNNLESKLYISNNVYRTIGQLELNKSVNLNLNKSQIIVAPTSYGKTELILSFVEKFQDKNICIITPTKSLLTQTKKRIINQFGYRKIVTQPDMYSDIDLHILAVLTQERLLKLLQENRELSFDFVIVDEAHNLLDRYTSDDSRSVLLTSVLIINKKRNPESAYKYLTPFLIDRKSLEIKYLDDNFNEWYKVTEQVKSEMFYFHDLNRNTKELLDQFSPKSHKFIQIQNQSITNDYQVIMNEADRKNIIYLNKPVDIERFAIELSNNLKPIDKPFIKKILNDLQEFIHKDYKLIECIRKGVVYHHGSMPESIRFYIEELYSEIDEIKYLVANSTLLEGVNLPATRMFILNPKRGNSYLTPSGFKNLIGRICRFSEIFNQKTGNLDYLLPEIHIIKGKYAPINMNFEQFIKGRKLLIQDENSSQDYPENPLLTYTSSSDDEKVKAEELLANISDDNLEIQETVNIAKTKVGKLLYQNNVTIFNIFTMEMEIQSQMSNVSIAENIDSVFKILDFLFFKRIDENSNEENLRRLKSHKAQAFYIMLISWRMRSKKMTAMVTDVLNYWDNLSIKEKESIFVGKWGDKTRGGGFRKLWTDLNQKNHLERVNLAIVRLKEEYDFIDNEIMKFIDVLYKLNLISVSLYNKIKFGTTDETRIAMLNCGVSGIICDLLEEKYKDYYSVDLKQCSIFFDPMIIDKMNENKENGILISEVKLNMRE